MTFWVLYVLPNHSMAQPRVFIATLLPFARIAFSMSSRRRYRPLFVQQDARTPPTLSCLGLQMVIQWSNGAGAWFSSGVKPMLKKKLSKHGNSLALVIDRSILELLGIDEHTTLDISTDGRALVVVPAHDKRRRKRFQDALTACNEQYGKALKRLAE